MKDPRTIRTLIIAGTMGAVALRSLVPASAANASEESCFVSAINATRSSAGVAPLSTNGDLVGVARTWSQTMATAGHIFHNTNIPNLAPSSWQSLGENVGVGPTCDAIARALVASPEHLRNILDPSYSSVGVGVVDAAGGVMYVTEDFMGTGAPSARVVTPAPAPARVKPAPAPAPVAKPAAPAPVAAPQARTVPAGKATAAPAATAPAAPRAAAPPPAVPAAAMPIVDHTLIVRGPTPDTSPTASVPRGILGGVVKALGAFFAR